MLLFPVALNTILPFVVKILSLKVSMSSSGCVFNCTRLFGVIDINTPTVVSGIITLHFPVVLSTPLIKNIKKLYPNSEITYVTTPAGRVVLSNNPYLKEVIAYDKRGKNKGFKGMLNLAKQLRNKKFDITYIPHRYLRSSLICFLAKIPSRIGYDISEGKLFLNKKIEYRKDLHEVERLLKLLDTECNDKKIELYPSKEDKEYIDNYLKDKNTNNKKLIALAIGSKWNTKRWPIEYFNELIERLERLDDVKIVLVGGNEEKDLLVKYSDKKFFNLFFS